MTSIKEIDKWYYNLSETKKWKISMTISPDELDDDFWEYIDDNLKRNIYKDIGGVRE